MLKNALFLLLFLIAPLAHAQDMFQEYLYNADLVMKNREKIYLTDAQADKIKKIHSTNAADFSTLKWDLDAATAELRKLLGQTKPDPVAVSKQMDLVLNLENQLKKKQLATLVAIKNELTETQQGILKSSNNWTLYGTSEKFPAQVRSGYPQFQVGSESINLTGVASKESVKGITSTIDGSGSIVLIPSDASKFKIKGTSNDGKNKPLYFLETKNGYQEMASLDDIKSDEIQSITVLKDESAVAKFGEKAKNGVIIIVMKQTPEEF